MDSRQPSPQELSAFVDGELPSRRRREIERLATSDADLASKIARERNVSAELRRSLRSSPEHLQRLAGRVLASSSPESTEDLLADDARDVYSSIWGPRQVERPRSQRVLAVVAVLAASLVGGVLLWTLFVQPLQEEDGLATPNDASIGTRGTSRNVELGAVAAPVVILEREARTFDPILLGSEPVWDRPTPRLGVQRRRQVRTLFVRLPATWPASSSASPQVAGGTSERETTLHVHDADRNPDPQPTSERELIIELETEQSRLIRYVSNTWN